MTKALPLLLRPMLKSFLRSGSDREPSRPDAASISATGKDLAPASHGFNHAACFIDSISVAFLIGFGAVHSLRHRPSLQIVVRPGFGSSTVMLPLSQLSNS